MPSLKSSLKPVDPVRYRPIGPVNAPIPGLPGIGAPPSLPVHLMPSPVRISGLPSISTNVDGITRMFYPANNLPQRRLILPTQ